jgi:single-strand DNA-binding protein
MRSFTRVSILGNVTRDAELRYTASGQAVATFTVATNRSWTTNGEKREESQYTRCVAWAKLAEICGKTVTRGKAVYVEGRLQTRKYEHEGQQRESTEVILSDMILLGAPEKVIDSVVEMVAPAQPDEPEDVDLADIPF